MAKGTTVIEQNRVWVTCDNKTIVVEKIVEHPGLSRIRIAKTDSLVKFPDAVDFYLTKEQIESLIDALEKGIKL